MRTIKFILLLAGSWKRGMLVMDDRDKLSPEDQAGREAVFKWLHDCFAVCTNDCPSVNLKDWYGCGGVNLVFTSGGTASETLEWRADSWDELHRLIKLHPDGVDYD